MGLSVRSVRVRLRTNRDAERPARQSSSAPDVMSARHSGPKKFAEAKEILASLEIAFIYQLRDAIRTCLWPIVVMQRRSATFLAEPVVVDRVPRGRSIWLLSDAGPQRPGLKPSTG